MAKTVHKPHPQPARILSHKVFKGENKEVKRMEADARSEGINYGQYVGQTENPVSVCKAPKKYTSANQRAKRAARKGKK